MSKPMTRSLKKIIHTSYAALLGAVIASVSPATLAVDDIVGNLSGDFSVNAGQVAYSLPIATPEGIHGLMPSISVSYSNNTGAGLLGAGFTLSASSSISRCNANVDLDGFKAGIELNDNARFCIDGKRLIAISGKNGIANTEYRNVDDKNVRYFSRGGSNHTPMYWEIQSPEGFRYKYEQASTTHTRFSAWYLTEKSDFFGNTIHYHYSTGLMPEITSISYSGYTVAFHYEDRQQPISQYRDGYHFELAKRLNHITISRNNTELNRYRFHYESIITDDGVSPHLPLEKLKRLASIDKCYGVNGQAACLRPVHFSYQEQPDAGLGLDHPDDRTIVVPRAYYAASDTVDGVDLYTRPNYTTADINKDGLTDFCYYNIGAGIMCATSNTAGGYDAPTAWTANLGYAATEEQYPYYSQIQLIDLNADTYPDFCLTDDTGVRCGINNGGTGFTSIGYKITALNHESSPTFSFINDDIYPDMCGLSQDGVNYQCFSGNGTGFSSSTIVNLGNRTVDYIGRLSTSGVDCSTNTFCNLAGFSTTDDVINMPSPQWIDIDGDLDNDLCWLSATSSGLTCAYRSIDPSNQQLQFSAPQVVHPLNYGVLSTATISSSAVEAAKESARRFVTAFRFADINADALPDICYAQGHQYYCALNKGDSFANAAPWINVSSLFDDFEPDNDLSVLTTIRLDDMNLDGLVDFCIIKNEQQQCAYNQVGSFGELEVRQAIVADVDSNLQTGEFYANFIQKITDKIGGVFGSWKTRYVAGTTNLAYGNLANVPDINGDGYPEYCYRSIHGILCTSNDNHGPAALLTSITDSFGQTTSIAYGSLISDGLYDPATDIPAGYQEQPTNRVVVDTVTVDSSVVDYQWPTVDPIRNSQSYRYRGFVLNPTTSVSGFSAITVKQNERDVSTTIHLSVAEHLVGQQLFIEEYIGDQRVKTKRNDYRVIGLPHGRHRISLDLAEAKQFDLDGTLVSTTTTTSANLDSYGFPQQATMVKTMAESGETLTTTTTTEYYHDTDYWILARPDLQTVEHQYQGNSITRVVDYHFTDSLMTGETIQPSASNASSVSYTYDAAGNTETVTTSGNGQSRTITKAFDSLGRVTTLSNSLGQSEHFTYHATCPAAVGHTDIAGKQTQTYYDDVCRQVRVEGEDDNVTTWQYAWATEDDNSRVNQPIDHPYAYRNPIIHNVTETHANGQWSKAGIDAQGRTVRSESIGFSSERFDRVVVSNTAYDRFGRKTATTLPYYRINGEYVTPSWVCVVYDDASRIQTEQKIGPDGQPLTTDYSYTKNSATVNVSDYSKTTQTGVFGKPLQITENDLSIHYAYDPLGNLISTEQNGATTSLSYDSRGFKVQQVDPAMGTWTYQYNAFGELISQTDAKNQTTAFIYDQLGRLIERLEPEGQTTWIYNNSGNGIGQLDQEQGINTTKQWAYDVLGRPVSETLMVDGQQFITQLSYDQYSRLKTTTQPNGLDIHHNYDTTGGLSRVSIPANQVRGFDVAQMKAEYEAVLLALIAVEDDIQQLEERRAYHLAKSLEYEQQALHYVGLLGAVNEEITLLQLLIAEHQDLAERYQLAADDLRAQATAYKSLYGDRVFSYTGSSNGKHNFKTVWCSDRHRIMGGCKTYQQRYVSVSAGNFNAIDDGQPVYASYILPSICTRSITDYTPATNDNDYTPQPIYSVSCTEPEIVSAPICVPADVYRETENEAGITGAWVHTRQCASLGQPHRLYSEAANDFAALRDAEIAKAAAYQAQISTDGANPLAVQVQKIVLTGRTIKVWVPIGTDIISMIQVDTEETELVWESLSLEETVTYYEDKITYYTDLANEELDAYNDLSREWQDAASLLDDLHIAQYDFAQLLQSAGIIVGDDLSVSELLDNAESRQDQWADSSTPLMVWAATMRAPNGLVQNELFGNGLYSKRTVNKDTGLITSIETGAYSGESPLRKIDYTFNSRGMIIEKNDTSNAVNQTAEQYEYDTQGRLRGWVFHQNIAGDAPRQNNLWRTYDYDNRGNMTYKTGAGLAMHYNAANQLTARDVADGLTVNYSYDANGNMQQGDDRQYQWNSFNKVDQVSRGNHTVQFDYDANHKRVVKTSDVETIYYVNPSYEKVVKHLDDGTTEVIHRHNIWNGHEVVASFEKREDNSSSHDFATSDDVKYYHRDHLGSGELVTAADMSVLSQRLYTPYGELVEDVLSREQNASTQVALLLNYSADDYMQEIIDNNDALGSDISLLSQAMHGPGDINNDYRGFTSHETINEVGLVNMNARLYDPVIGRFVSADSVIPDISNPLDYNRYAYVRGNPVMYSDPTGHSPLALAFYIVAHLTDNQALQQFSTLVLAASMGGEGGWFESAGTWQSASISAAQISATITFLQTGDLKATAEAAAWSALSAGITHNIGDHFATGAKLEGHHWTQAGLHALSQGTISALRGDSFAAGAISGLSSSLVASHSGSLSYEMTMALTMASGYISAEAVGGDGVQGALNAAIVFLYNHHGEHDTEKGAEKAYNDLRDGLIKTAEDNPDIIIALTMDDINIVVKHYRNVVAGMEKYSFLSDEYKGQFSAADTFFYRAKNSAGEHVLVGRLFSLEGRIYYGGEINYIGVGMLASHYGGLTRVLLNPMVTKWNYDQYMDGEGDHNLRQIYMGNQWAKYGAYRY